MGLRKSVWLGLIAVFILNQILLAGCGQQKEGLRAGGVTITDSTGKSLTLPQPLNRVVVLNSDAAEAIRILKAQDAVIGVGDTVQKNPYLGLQDKTVVGKWNEPSYEKIVELKPQVVIAYSKSPGEELTQKLEPAGIKVVRRDLFKPETYNSDLRSLAVMFGKEKGAEDFIKWKAEKTAVVANSLQGLQPEQKLRVFSVWSSNFLKGNWKTFAQGTSVHQGIELAGGINVAGALKDYPQVNPEWILQQNPAAIVLGTYSDEDLGYGVNDNSNAGKLKEKAIKSEVLSQTEAVKNGRVYVIHTKLLGGDKTYLGALYLGKWFYPDRFKDINPEQVLKEYFEQWVGVPFKGKWAYPG